MCILSKMILKRLRKEHPSTVGFTKNRKNIREKQNTRNRSQGIADNIEKGRIPHGEIYLGQLDGDADAEAERYGDPVCNRSGNIF